MQKVVRSKGESTRLRQIEKRWNDKLQQESIRAICCVFAAASIALWETEGWRQKRITDLLHETEAAWNECAGQPDVSILRMLEEETGIEIRARGCDKSWHELDYLSGDVPAHPMGEAEWIYMRQRQIMWVEPQITGSLLIALHRLHGWSGVRDGRLLERIEEIESEHGYKTAALLRSCKELTGINIRQEVEV